MFHPQIFVLVYQIQLHIVQIYVFAYYGLGCRNVSKLYVPKAYNFDLLFEAFYKYKYVLDNKKSGYANLQAFKSDQKMMDGLKKIYPDVDDDWLDVFYKQHKVILDKFAGSQITKFDHSGKGSFMNKITIV